MNTDLAECCPGQMGVREQSIDSAPFAPQGKICRPTWWSPTEDRRTGQIPLPYELSVDRGSFVRHNPKEAAP